MGWIAISDLHTAYFAPPEGISPDEKFVRRGSILIETSLSADTRPQMLFAYREVFPWERSISLQALPGGGVVLILSQNSETSHVALKAELTERTHILRITYSWDIDLGFGRLAIEHPENGKVQSTKFSQPYALALDDIKSMIEAPILVQRDVDVDLVAVSDQIEPLGPMPTLSGSVPILLSGRYRNVNEIKRGDVIQSWEHGPVPVLANISRTVPARGSFRPVRLRAPYFGLQQDIIVAPDQKLVVSQPMVEYMFGREAVLVPARHLVNGRSAIWHDLPLTMTYHQLILPEHETLIAAGSALESAFIGRLRRKRERIAETLLASLPRRELPEHMISSFPILRPFDALTLLEHCAA